MWLEEASHLPVGGRGQPAITALHTHKMCKMEYVNPRLMVEKSLPHILIKYIYKFANFLNIMIYLYIHCLFGCIAYMILS